MKKEGRGWTLRNSRPIVRPRGETTGPRAGPGHLRLDVAVVEEVVKVLMECRMVHPMMFAGQIVREDVAVKSMAAAVGR